MATFVKRTVTVVEEIVVAAGVPTPAPVVEVVQPAPVRLPAPPSFKRGDKVRYAARGKGFKTYYVVRVESDGRVRITSPDRRIAFPVEPAKLYHSKF
jgi:hypothetical protein